MVKPAYDEQADVAVINGNMATIDGMIYQNEQDLDALETLIGDAAFIRKEITRGGSVDFTFSGYIFMVFFCCGASSTQKCILIVSCNSSGSVQVVKIGDASNVTTSTTTNKLTINNGYETGGMQVMGMRISGSANTMPT